MENIKMIDVNEFLVKDIHDDKENSAKKNSEAWKEILRYIHNLNDESVVKITVPEGTYYFDSTLKIPSNTILEGKSKEKTKIIFTKPVPGVQSEFNKIEPTGEIEAKNITLQNIGFSYEDIGADARVSVIEFSKKYLDEYKEYKSFENIKLDNIHVNGNELGTSLIFLGGIKGLSINGSIIENAGLQNGVVLEYCDNVIIENNTIRNTGRTGIQLYRGNGSSKENDIIIRKNHVSKWMQRYGSFYYLELKMTDIMADAGIDSYGPNNRNVLIEENVLEAGEGADQKNPCNIIISEELGKPDFQSTTLYTGIRLSGITDAKVYKNKVTLNSADSFAFLTANSRERSGNTTKPDNLTILNNHLISNGIIRFPIRLFDGTAREGRGINIEQNCIIVQGKVDNYYRTLIENRLESEIITVTDNQLKTFKSNGELANDASIVKNLVSANQKITTLVIWGNNIPSGVHEVTPPNNVGNIYNGNASYSPTNPYIKGVINNNQGHYKQLLLLIDDTPIRRAEINGVDGSFRVYGTGGIISPFSKILLRFQTGTTKYYESEMIVSYEK